MNPKWSSKPSITGDQFKARRPLPTTSVVGGKKRVSVMPTLHVFGSLLILCAYIAAPTSAGAVSLGDVHVTSRLGEPLQGSISLSAGPGEQLGADCFRLSVNGTPLATRFRGDSEAGQLLLSSSGPLREPLLNLRLVVRCQPLASTTKDFALFLDPPSLRKPVLAEKDRTRRKPSLVEIAEATKRNLPPPLPTEPAPQPTDLTPDEVPPETDANALVGSQPTSLSELELHEIEIHSKRLVLDETSQTPQSLPPLVDSALPKIAKSPAMEPATSVTASESTVNSVPEPTTTPRPSSLGPKPPGSSMTDSKPVDTPQQTASLFSPVLIAITLFLILTSIVGWCFLRRTPVEQKTVVPEARDWLNKEKEQTMISEIFMDHPIDSENMDFDLEEVAETQHDKTEVIQREHAPTQQLEASYLEDLVRNEPKDS